MTLWEEATLYRRNERVRKETYSQAVVAMPLIQVLMGEGRGGRQISMYKVERPAQSTEQVLRQTCPQNKKKS